MTSSLKISPPFLTPGPLVPPASTLPSNTTPPPPTTNATLTLLPVQSTGSKQVSHCHWGSSETPPPSTAKGHHPPGIPKFCNARSSQSHQSSPPLEHSATGFSGALGTQRQVLILQSPTALEECWQAWRGELGSGPGLGVVRGALKWSFHPGCAPCQGSPSLCSDLHAIPWS